VRIRPATREDAAEIARCIIMAEGEMIPFLTGHEDARLAEEKLAGWILSEVPNRYSLENTLIAETDGGPVAAAITFPADAQPSLDSLILEDVRRRGRDLKRLFFEGIPDTYYLSTMGVEPGYRRRGIGTALMTAAQDSAKSRGFARASLLVDQDKLRAKAMYERQGFRAVGEVTLVHFKYWRMLRDL
jgi:ribosomal protein S18 acetylase RimI-like enzyme